MAVDEIPQCFNQLITKGEARNPPTQLCVQITNCKIVRAVKILSSGWQRTTQRSAPPKKNLMPHSCNPSIQDTAAGWLLTSLRPVTATQQNPVSKPKAKQLAGGSSHRRSFPGLNLRELSSFLYERVIYQNKHTVVFNILVLFLIKPKILFMYIQKHQK